jgi:hypothetical protein
MLASMIVANAGEMPAPFVWACRQWDEMPLAVGPTGEKVRDLSDKFRNEACRIKTQTRGTCAPRGPDTERLVLFGAFR